MSKWIRCYDKRPPVGELVIGYNDVTKNYYVVKRMDAFHPWEYRTSGGLYVPIHYWHPLHKICPPGGR